MHLFSLISLSDYFSNMVVYFSEFVDFLFLPLKEVVIGLVLTDNPIWDLVGLELFLDTFGDGFFVNNSLFTVLLGSSAIIFVGHTVLRWFKP